MSASERRPRHRAKMPTPKPRVRNPDRVPLLPCPFDGGRGRLIDNGPTWMPHAADCATCHARTTWFRVQADAVMAWNRRVK